MVGLNPQICKEKRLSRWFTASAFRLDRHEHCSDLLKCLGVLNFQDPPFVCRNILIKNSKVLKHRYEKNHGLPKPGRNSHLLRQVLVEVEAVKDQGLVFGEESPRKWFQIFAVLADIVHVRDQELARTH